jgi:hypothetical protein
LHRLRRTFQQSARAGFSLQNSHATPASAVATWIAWLLGQAR